MKSVAELALSLCDLIEAEGRLLRVNIQRTGRGCGIMAIGLVFVAAALAFLTAAIYVWLADWLSRPAALLIMAGVCVLFAAILIWSANAWNKKPKQRAQKQ